MGVVIRLLRQVQPYRWRVALALGMVFMSTGLVAVQPMLIRFTVDEVFQAGRWHLLGWVALGLLLATVLRSAFGYLERISMEWIAQRTIYDLRNAIYHHLQSLSFSFYDQAQTGELMSRATADVEMMRRFLSFGILRLTSSALTLVVVMTLLLTMDVRLALVSMASIPLLVLAIWRFATTVRPRYKQIQEQLGTITAVLQEAIAGVRVVRAFAQEDREIERFRRENWHYLDLNITTVRLWALYFPLMTFLGGLGSTVVLWYGGSRVIAGELSVGAMIAFQTLLMQLVMPIRMLGWLVNMASQAVAAGQRVYTILDTASDVRDKPSAVDLVRPAGHVRFNRVSFSYDGKSSVLDDVSIDAKPGQTIALLGTTGSGKSTVINLIPRFYDVTTGSITIDGMDVRDVTLKSLRANIGMVLQETFLFSASLKDNIAYGRPGAKEHELIAAAKAAQIHDFILSLPEGYNTLIGERGIGLSGGQKQRVAVARALLMDPRVLILDEATSSVDSETELAMQRALQAVMRNRTTFVIAQRLSTVRGAHQIIVLQEGQIVEQGTHDTLLAQNGIYREIYDLQFRQQDSTQNQTDKGGE
ncbi:MAG: putative multidrug export ATP-binding/permease protein [Firmicutes bacterium]|nr:putative multidrug export ATP-binding/permease protein [candidate division NPL-UPA2 bacterium]